MIKGRYDFGKTHTNIYEVKNINRNLQICNHTERFVILLNILKQQLLEQTKISVNIEYLNKAIYKLDIIAIHGMRIKQLDSFMLFSSTRNLFKNERALATKKLSTDVNNKIRNHQQKHRHLDI